MTLATKCTTASATRCTRGAWDGIDNEEHRLGDDGALPDGSEDIVSPDPSSAPSNQAGRHWIWPDLADNDNKDTGSSLRTSSSLLVVVRKGGALVGSGIASLVDDHRDLVSPAASRRDLVSLAVGRCDDIFLVLLCHIRHGPKGIMVMSRWLKCEKKLKIA